MNDIEKVIEGLEYCSRRRGGSCISCSGRECWCDEAIKRLKEQPDIVRCKDCKHLFDGEHTENCCDVLMKKTGWLKEISVSLDWFCADGERRVTDARQTQ